MKGPWLAQDVLLHSLSLNRMGSSSEDAPSDPSSVCRHLKRFEWGSNCCISREANRVPCSSMPGHRGSPSSPPKRELEMW